MEQKTYNESLREYWDMYSITETSFLEGTVGREEGKEEGREEERHDMEKTLVLRMHNQGISVDEIVKLTGFAKERVLQIIKS